MGMMIIPDLIVDGQVTLGSTDASWLPRGPGRRALGIFRHMRYVLFCASDGASCQDGTMTTNALSLGREKDTPPGSPKRTFRVLP